MFVQPGSVCLAWSGVPDYGERTDGLQVWSKEIKEDMKKAFMKIVEDIQVHVKQLAFSERAMLLLVRNPPLRCIAHHLTMA
jgi:hypothetical protein